jgi:hypothetical protein
MVDLSFEEKGVYFLRLISDDKGVFLVEKLVLD